MSVRTDYRSNVLIQPLVKDPKETVVDRTTTLGKDWISGIKNTCTVIFGYTVFVHLLFAMGDDGKHPGGEPFYNAFYGIELVCLTVILITKKLLPIK